MEINVEVKELIKQILKINDDKYTEDLEIGDIPEWDSANNVRLIQALEDKFKINIDISDAIEIEGVQDILILLKNYKVG